MKFLKNLKQLFFHSHLSKLKVGDIILARRYHNDEEKNNILEGHRESPFIIIKKTLFKVYALECSSILGNVSSPLLKLKIMSNKYKIKKDSYVYLGRLDLLDKTRFITKIDSLDDLDLNRIYKGIYLVCKYIKTIKLPNFKFTYDIGDIVEYNQKLYYIHNKDDLNYYVWIVKEAKKDLNTVLINHKNYYFYTNKTSISKLDSLILVNMADDRMQEVIYAKYQKLVKELKNRGIVNRGKLIVVNGSYYYIYGEYQNYFLVYKIYLKFSSEYFKIEIHGGYYYTLFEEMMIKKNDEIKIKRVATDIEMDNIKNYRKLLKIKSKKNIEVTMFKKLKIGYIVIDTYSLNQYIIVDRGPDFLVLSSFDELNFYFFNLHNSSHFEVVESYDRFQFAKLKEYYDKFIKDKEKLQKYRR